jgi:hypothetical protein
MKSTSLITRLMTTATFASLIIVGCKKESSQSLSPQQEEQAATISTQSETQTELVSNDIFDNVMGASNDVGIQGTGVFGRLASGRESSTGADLKTDTTNSFNVTITHLSSTEFFPLQIVIDFGAGGICKDGHTRYGKITTVYTGHLLVPGKSATTTFDGYKIDSISVTGTHVLTNTSTSSQMQFTTDMTDGKLTAPSGNYISWTRHRVLTQIEGNGTPAWPIDDVFSLTGTTSAKAQAGDVLVAWNSEITEPLIKKFTCPWIEKGVMKVRRENLAVNSQWTAVLDFGTGDCDNKASLTINGKEYQITLH